MGTSLGTSGGGRPGLAGLVVVGMIGAAAILLAAIRWSAEDEGSGRTIDVGPAVARPSASPEAGGFAFWGVDHEGGPLRWDACAPVRFRLSIADAPPHAEQDVRRALHLLSEASGLDLLLEGLTEERPDRRRPLVEREGREWRWRPVLIAWAHPGEHDVPLTSLDRGVALPVAVRDGSDEAFVTGQVVINAGRSDIVAGFGDRSNSLGATLLHELGHILGLDHVSDTTQLMSVDPGSGPVQLGEGDLAGLHAVGAAAGCGRTPGAASGRGLAAR